ncbi:DUF819 domain-containing protein [Maribacter halichondriae]|uniref:DUF819 family protein n=1 Tax=Maribacter halichondriae TaxID=2980554 RepID=UPI0023585762|nr:DUF819 family protein [Maribacter sp. Hal144]
MTFIENPIYVLGVLCLMVMLSIYAGKTQWGSKIGAALLVILFTAVLANLGVIPSASNTIPLYGGIFHYVAPISIFYLLLGVNLKSIKKAGAPMIILFLIGSLATVIGILVAWFLISPKEVLGDDANIIAGMLTGTYTGGSINFNAVALEYDFQEQGNLYAGTIAVDNVVTTIWIMVTLAFPALLRKFWKDKKVKQSTTSNHEMEDDKIDLNALMWLAFLGISAFFLAELVKLILPNIPFMLTLSTIGILVAQIPFVSRLPGSHTLGLYLVYLFLAVIGAYCEVNAVLALKEIGITLLLFTSLAVFMHGILIILFGSLAYLDWDMISVASQANVGGGPTALAMAESFGRKELVLPAILIGTLGNALGTYLGFLVVGVLA